MSLGVTVLNMSVGRAVFLSGGSGLPVRLFGVIIAGNESEGGRGWS